MANSHLYDGGSISVGNRSGHRFSGQGRQFRFQLLDGLDKRGVIPFDTFPIDGFLP